METTPHMNYFAQTDFRGKKTTFGIKSEDRARHVYVIGKTGMGKSTLLENLAIQDIKNGEGMAFIDPHGKSAEMLLDYVPKERINDVMYFAPFDLENPIAFNIMEDVGPDYRHLVADGLMATFKKIWQDAWSARMEYILNNTLLALLEYPDATLLGVNRMLSDKNYRKKVVDNISDPAVRSFWVDEFANYTDRFAAEATPAIQNKVGQFTNNPLIRNIIGQPKSSFDLRKMMDEKKIVIVNLSKGLVGEQNTQLLGGMLVTKMYLAAMSRANASDAEMRTLPPFYLYVDEFQSFANESFADILSEARKYKLSLTIAHQYIEQMPEEVRSAVFGNVGTLVSFRVGPFDAEVLETVFAPTFQQEDLVNLGFAQIYLTLMIDGVGSRPFSAVTLPPIVNADPSLKDEIIGVSRRKYGRKRSEVDKYIVDWVNSGRENNSGGNNSGVKNSSPNNKKTVSKNNSSSHATKTSESQNDKSIKKDSLNNFKSIDRPTVSQTIKTKTLSLSDLIKKKPVKEKSSETSRHALRDALKDLIGDNKANDDSGVKKEPTRLTQENPKSKTSSPTPIKNNPKSGQTESIRQSNSEVPEDKLRQVLAIDED